jgi:hypothetical protein
MENAILMPHGFDPLLCPDESPNPLNTKESMPCALSTKTQPDSRGLDPRIQAPIAPSCLDGRVIGRSEERPSFDGLCPAMTLEYWCGFAGLVSL